MARSEVARMRDGKSYHMGLAGRFLTTVGRLAAKSFFLHFPNEAPFLPWLKIVYECIGQQFEPMTSIL